MGFLEDWRMFSSFKFEVNEQSSHVSDYQKSKDLGNRKVDCVYFHFLHSFYLDTNLHIFKWFIQYIMELLTWALKQINKTPDEFEIFSDSYAAPL